MSTTETRSYVELAKGTRVRTLRTARRLVSENGSFVRDADGGYVTVEYPAGTEAVVLSCTHAGFRGREHCLRLADGHLLSGLSFTHLEVIR